MVDTPTTTTQQTPTAYEPYFKWKGLLDMHGTNTATDSDPSTPELESTTAPSLGLSFKEFIVSTPEKNPWRLTLTLEKGGFSVLPSPAALTIPSVNLALGYKKLYELRTGINPTSADVTVGAGINDFWQRYKETKLGVNAAIGNLTSGQWELSALTFTGELALPNNLSNAAAAADGGAFALEGEYTISGFNAEEPVVIPHYNLSLMMDTSSPLRHEGTFSAKTNFKIFPEKFPRMFIGPSAKYSFARGGAVLDAEHPESDALTLGATFSIAESGLVALTNTGSADGTTPEVATSLSNFDLTVNWTPPFLNSQRYDASLPQNEGIEDANYYDWTRGATDTSTLDVQVGWQLPFEELDLRAAKYFPLKVYGQWKHAESSTQTSYFDTNETEQILETGRVPTNTLVIGLSYNADSAQMRKKKK